MRRTALPVAEEAGITTPLAGRLTLREAVTEHLRDAIVRGELKPGQLLREVALANALGVSPTPVREALAELAGEGLVEMEAHRQRRVAPLSPATMLDLLLVQSELWRLAYRWGAAGVDAAGRAALAVAVDDYRSSLAARDLLGMVRAAHAFHGTFILGAANAELVRATLDRRSLVARFILRHSRATLTRRGLLQHEAMLRAFDRGDTAGLLALFDQMCASLVALARSLSEAGAETHPNAERD